jgi:hypothetical protein
VNATYERGEQNVTATSLKGRLKCTDQLALDRTSRKANSAARRHSS